MPQSQKISAIGLAAFAVLGLVYTFVAGNQPLRGLDLQGGVSVVLQPTVDVDEEKLNQTVEIIRSRVDALGVAEPNVGPQGNNIVVELPGAEEQHRALELVGQTAELRFRPVIAPLGPAIEFEEVQSDAENEDTPQDGDSESDDSESDDSESDDSESDDSESDDSEEEGLGPRVRERRQSDESEDTEPDAATDDNDDAPAADETESDDPAADETESDDPATDDPATDDPATDETESEDEAPAAPVETLSPEAVAVGEACGILGVTPPEEDFADSYVVLADRDGFRQCLGPALLTGDVLDTADVSLPGLSQWQVNPVFKSGPQGIDAFNEVAALCFAGSTTCPTRQLAIVLDHEVVSAPTINAASFDRENVNITGDFTEDEARELALVLRYGALPVELEAQQTRTVSATIGSDVLRSGVIAGLIGLALVAIYLLLYYRLAALVAITGIGISGMLLWTIIAWLGETQGLAITLAGIVGLIVSTGVSADSNIVYFENVKDIVGSGRRVSTAIERGYQSAISTIVKADVVSLIAAVLLYFLTLGAVRGFAFYLGIATLLDLVVSYMFMRPALTWLAQRKRVQDNPALLGMPARDGQPTIGGRA